ncbi:ABC transporter ATP-binding protein [Legionella spiritensis]|uniref:ABC transporter, ATP binding/permease protein MsbA n=1 Tax=Legionella spiritensis TaxID=452 RepID=A0A0W0ZAP1_LEGSP|nr:ABC transporter ATP-binding protein [Legionella spiritensis]KTD66199.1 ABC transporter, ATP binding/permease protein MsbA [Legionella spiritensis]SNV35195.1 ABC transporter, ATP binding/permease protein MsbA [Legionella spiritensis]
MNKEAYLETSRYPLLRLLSYMKGDRRQYMAAILFSVLNKLFDIFPEVLIGAAVDVVVNRKASWMAKLFANPNMMFQLAMLGIMTFIAWCLESVFQYLYSVQWRNLAQSVEHRLRMETYRHIQSARMEDIDNTAVGQLISIINDDINQLERFLEDGINQIIQIFSSTVLIGIIFFICSPLITVFAILPVPFILLGAFYFQHKLEPKFLNVRKKAADISSALSTNLTGLMTIKSYTAEAFEAKRIEKISLDYQNANRETIVISSMVTPVIRIMILTGFLFTLLIGGYKTIQGTMNVGVFSLLIFLSQRLLWPFSTLADVTVNFQRAMASTTRALNLLIWKNESGQSQLTTVVEPHTEQSDGLVMVDLGFTYPGASQPVFTAFNLDIKPCQTVAFVGESGSGKSTLIKLLCRFYQHSQGDILWNGDRINDFNLEEWRHHIALVSQDIFLFEGTIADNIAYAKQNASPDEIRHAAMIAGADKFISQLPEGYDSSVGQRGNYLSGGQKQRIAIARAVLKDAPILILDEATSAVDNDTELAIQQALATISHNKTTIIIAHRLSTVTNADRIYVLDKGAIIEQGTHDELLSEKTYYRHLWYIQTGEYRCQKELTTLI